MKNRIDGIKEICYTICSISKGKNIGGNVYVY